MPSLSQSQQFKITEAVISADRFGGFDALSYDVRTSIAELNIFESLDKPYLTGTIAILDDKGLFDRISFNGTEYIRITMTSVDNDLDPIFQRTFILTGVEQSVKSNDNGKSSLYLITFIDIHAFKSRLTKISRSFKGQLDDAIVKLVARELNLDVDLSYLFTATGDKSKCIQTNVKGIVPNLTVMQTIDWLLSRATTITGSPYFCYATVHDDNLRLGNLDVMLQQKAFNRKLPYTYNPSNVSVAENQTEFERGFVVKDITQKNSGNTLKLIDAGSVSANYGNTNLNTGRITNNHFTFRKTLNALERENIIKIDDQNIFDPYVKISDVLIDDYDAMKYHTVTSTGTYGTSKSYHDETNPNLFIKKLENRAIKNHLFKNEFQAIVTGTAFFISKAAVGDIVSMKVVNDNTEITEQSNEDDLLDKSKSGNFLIYDIRHTFQDTSHTVSMNLVKLVRER